MSSQSVSIETKSQNVLGDNSCKPTHESVQNSQKEKTAKKVDALIQFSGVLRICGWATLFCATMELGGAFAITILSLHNPPILTVSLLPVILKLYAAALILTIMGISFHICSIVCKCKAMKIERNLYKI